ncbi:MAG: DNA polymerase III subunit gamma/tau, partial [Ignavibacteria bacterium]
PDVFEIDGASNRNIEDVRELKEKVKYGPIRSKFKIFIIDEVHMLTGASFNALLKTLEEPPDYVIFIFATTAPEKVPLTILGRCQKFDFKRLSIEDIVSRIKLIAENEKVKIDDESLFFIAKKGDGSMRDAQGLFDISTAYCENDITFSKLKSFFNLAESDVFFRITDLIKEKDGKELLIYFDELLDKGYEMQTLLDGLSGHLRNLLVAKSTNSAELIMESDSVKKKYKEHIDKFSEIEIINSLKLIIQTEYTFKYSSNQRTLLEALLIELIKFTDTKDISDIINELNELKKNIYTESHTGTRQERKLISFDTSGAEEKLEATTFGPINENKESSRKELSYKENKKELQSENPEGLIKNNWQEIIEQLRNEKKWIYSLIKDCEMESEDEKNYLIKVSGERYEFLSGYKDFLASRLSDYFGKPINLNLIKKTEAEETTETQSGDADANFERICSILLKDFNGKVIDE